MMIPNVWSEPLKNNVLSAIKSEGAIAFRVHQLPQTLPEWENRKNVLRKLIWKCTGCKYDPSIPLNYTVTKSIDCDGYKVLCIHYQSRPGIVVTGNLYVPDGKGPFPAVLNVHGHWQQGRLAERVQSRGHSLAKNGFVCLSVDAWGSGERCDVHGEFIYHGGLRGGMLLPFGETLMGAQIVDNMRGVDLLCSLPFVDSDKLGVTGASGGGNQTMWVAAMDERLKAAMPVVSVGTFESYLMNMNCICECLPFGLTFTEESGVLALTAPRAMKICNALQDTNQAFFVPEMLRSYTRAREIYRLYGKETEFTYQAFPLPHGYWPEVREAMLGFFDYHLKGIGHGEPRSEIPFKALPEEEVMVFEQGKRPPEVMSIVDYLRKKAKEVVVREVTADTVADEQSELNSIFNMTKMTFSGCWPGLKNDGWKGWTIRANNGRVIPALSREGKNPKGRTAILAGPLGKAELANTPLLEKCLEDCSQVIVFDGLAMGENSDDRPNRIADYYCISRSLLWLGRTLLGEWAADFLLAMDFAIDEFDSREFLLGGVGELGISACLAAVFSESSASVAVRTQDMPPSWRDGEKGTLATASMAACVPNFAAWGDVATLKNVLSAVKIPIEEL